MGSKFIPHLIAWEVTRRCHLKCRHCRAAALDVKYRDELTTEEIKRTLDNIASFSKPIIILTGGEPMMRDDIYEIASCGDSLGLRMVMAPCGRFVDAEAISRMKASGIRRISLSIDGKDETSHDSLRGVNGSFDDVMRAAKFAREGGLPFQINTTVTKMNIGELPDILMLAKDIGAVSFHPFLFVPTGRGKDMPELELSSLEYEETLEMIGELSRAAGIHVKPTCAPHYFRIKGPHGILRCAPSLPRGSAQNDNLNPSTRGCLGGTGFAFISHVGSVQICGFLDVECGNLRESNFDLKKIWDESDIFLKMRDRAAYKGKCGICEYHGVCGGCRARAYALTGDFMNPEPYCVYVPKGRVAFGCAGDEEILTALQDDLPIVERPFVVIAERAGIDEGLLLNKIDGWMRDGLIRHLSARVDANALHFASALVAFKVGSAGITDANKAIASHPGVSHSYLRDHDYNIWFTIKAPRGFDISEQVARIAKASRAEKFLILPSIKTFKLDVKFDVASRKGGCAACAPALTDRWFDITGSDEAVIDALNLGLSVSARPFAALAAQLLMEEGALLQRIKKLKDEGVIGKLRFVLDHGKAGILANAMIVWDIEGGKKDEVGRYFAGKEFISHCYERAKREEFPYNIYTMVHAASDRELERHIEEMAGHVRPKAYRVLKTTKELLKRKTTLFSEEYFKWERI